ncbi:thiol peroxidase [Acetoanaerobium pronyense]|uniref:Thiol peroxidase n=1 Tax=Acetoanaerobium pronyense TaxID=1482736 RepID=A0ABS4KI92_9FIRM|nr:thiol peroxidase [Acetoanaerobium pronyense]MBP2026976.1 thiol peroxidase [Acetoanaerobium pronyense]
MEKRSGIITMKGNPVTLAGKEIKVGDKAPNFKVIDNDMNEVSFETFKGKKVIISVVPSLDTSVCEFQTTSFNERASEIEDVVILTISVDLPFAQKRFCVGKGIDKVKVYSDHRDLSFGKEYGFIIEELRLLARGIVVVDKEGIVKYVEYVKEVTEHPDYDKAIEEAKKLI